MLEIVAICLVTLMLLFLGVGGTFYPHKLRDYHIKIGSDNLKAVGMETMANRTWWHPSIFQYRFFGGICLIVGVWMIYQIFEHWLM